MGKRDRSVKNSAKHAEAMGQPSWLELPLEARRWAVRRAIGELRYRANDCGANGTNREEGRIRAALALIAFLEKL